MDAGMKEGPAYDKAVQDLKKGAMTDLLTPAAILQRAERIVSGDQGGYAQIGRGTQGAQNLKNLDEKVAELLAKKGWTGADITQAMVENQGRRAAARSLGTREALMAMAIGEAMPMGQLVIEASEKYKRTNLPPVNKAINAWKTNTGDPAIKAYGAAINSFLNAYVRAVSPIGAPTDLVRKHSYDRLNEQDSPAAVRAVIAMMNKEMQAAWSAPERVRQMFRDGAAGKIVDLFDKGKLKDETGPVVVPIDDANNPHDATFTDSDGKTYGHKRGTPQKGKDNWELVPALKVNENMEDMRGVVEATARMAPGGLPWRQWRRSANVEDNRSGDNDYDMEEVGQHMEVSQLGRQLGITDIDKMIDQLGLAAAEEMLRQHFVPMPRRRPNF
jgi:hypothetical protein